MKKNFVKVLGVLLLLVPLNIKAASGTITYDSTTLNINETKDITVYLSNPNDVQAVGGFITSNDSSCVKINSVVTAGTPVFSFNDKNNKFALFGTDVYANGTAIMKVNVTGLKACNTSFNITSAKVSGTDFVDYNATISSSKIFVKGEGSSTKSSDATLKELSISKGTLSPAFDKDKTEYNVEVENDVDSINITATKNDNGASITGDGNKDLSVGTNRLEVKVVAEDGTTSRSYYINVTRKGGSEEGGEPGSGEDTPDPTPVDNRSSDNTLKSLSVSKGNLYPAFDPNSTTYSITVDNDVTSIDVSALANDEKASVSISGNTNLREGMNTIQVKVTAENESVKTYTINVNRKKSGNTKNEPEKSSNNLLKSLLVGDGALKPDFDPNTADYSLTVGNDINALDLQAIAQDNKAKVEISNNENLIVGKNVITITVTAENGAQRIYTVNVIKVDKEPNNKLDDITVSEGELTPKFDPNHTFYDIEVPSNTKEIDVTPKLSNPNSKVHYIVNGVSQENGKVKLNEGNNLVQLQIEDENGFVKSYYLTINRKLSYYSIFGLKVPKWLIYTLLILFILLFAYLLYLLLKKRKKKEETPVVQTAPTIEFKPEFNFGSKNQDNDQVQDGGVLNQNSSEVKSQTEDHDEEKYNRPEEEVPYDPYDDIVTKDELMDAIIERDPEKLRILYEQEMLNRKKEELKAKEEEKGE